MDVAEAEKQSYYYPNRIGRIILTAMEKEIGREHLDEVLRTGNLDELHKLPTSNLDRQFPFEWVSGLQAATETTYGLDSTPKCNGLLEEYLKR